jgi:hypothetical protein
MRFQKSIWDTLTKDQKICVLHNDIEYFMDWIRNDWKIRNHAEIVRRHGDIVRKHLRNCIHEIRIARKELKELYK